MKSTKPKIRINEFSGALLLPDGRPTAFAMASLIIRQGEIDMPKKTYSPCKSREYEIRVKHARMDNISLVVDSSLQFGEDVIFDPNSPDVKFAVFEASGGLSMKIDSSVLSSYDYDEEPFSSELFGYFSSHYNASSH
jgi:hypothetical protein